MSAPKISLDFFARTMHAEIDRFKDWWLAKHNENPEKYPAAFTADDWDERYTLFVEQESNPC